MGSRRDSTEYVTMSSLRSHNFMHPPPPTRPPRSIDKAGETCPLKQAEEPLADYSFYDPMEFATPRESEQDRTVYSDEGYGSISGRTPYSQRYGSSSDRTPYSQRYASSSDRTPYSQKYGSSSDRTPYSQRYGSSSDRTPYSEGYGSMDRSVYSERFSPISDTESPGEHKTTKPIHISASEALPETEHVPLPSLARKFARPQRHGTSKPSEPISSGRAAAPEYLPPAATKKEPIDRLTRRPAEPRVKNIGGGGTYVKVLPTLPEDILKKHFVPAQDTPERVKKRLARGSIISQPPPSTGTRDESKPAPGKLRPPQGLINKISAAHFGRSMPSASFAMPNRDRTKSTAATLVDTISKEPERRKSFSASSSTSSQADAAAVMRPPMPPPTPVVADKFVKSKRVFGLNSGNFYYFLNNKDVAMVFFYDPSFPDSCWSKKQVAKAAKKTKRPNHAYAAVNCREDPIVCEFERVPSVPFFRIYSKGSIVGSFQDFHRFTAKTIKSFVEASPVLPGAIAAQSKCALAKEAAQN